MGFYEVTYKLECGDHTEEGEFFCDDFVCPYEAALAGFAKLKHDIGEFVEGEKAEVTIHGEKRSYAMYSVETINFKYHRIGDFVDRAEADEIMEKIIKFDEWRNNDIFRWTWSEGKEKVLIFIDEKHDGTLIEMIGKEFPRLKYELYFSRKC